MQKATTITKKDEGSLKSVGSHQGDRRKDWKRMRKEGKREKGREREKGNTSNCIK